MIASLPSLPASHPAPAVSSPRLNAAAQEQLAADDGRTEATPDADDGQTRRSGATAAQDSATSGLSKDEQRVLDQLEARDREVRAHEAAHLATAGSLARGGASYSYQRGPDGQMYAIGGEVSLDVSEGRTPEESLAKAERIRAAALAPAQPSGKDMQVAAAATRMAAEARSELASQARQAYQSGDDTESGPGALIDRFA